MIIKIKVIKKMLTRFKREREEKKIKEKKGWINSIVTY